MTFKYIRTYMDNDFAFTPVYRCGKTPIHRDWTKRRFSCDEIIAEHENRGGINLGVILGEMSGGVVDVDIDSSAALCISNYLLPTSDMVFGRVSNPGSHRLYRVNDPTQTKQFKHPETGKMLIELRSNGAQTVFPGSVHTSGEVIRFEDGRDGLPSEATFAELEASCARIAACCLLAEVWKDGLTSPHAVVRVQS